MDDRDVSTIAVLNQIRDTPIDEIDIDSPAVRRVLDRFKAQLDADGEVAFFQSHTSSS